MRLMIGMQAMQAKGWRGQENFRNQVTVDGWLDGYTQEHSPQTRASNAS